jgi:5-methylcytosine-specific restriction endonuclease McrA
LNFIEAPPRDHRADFRMLSRSRTKAVADSLEFVSRSIFKAYRRYSDRSADASRIRPFRGSLRLRRALASNYRVLRDNGLYGDLLQLTGGRCPLCGFGEASTLEHYLPQSRYPEFSVFALNLIPACARCNLLKGDAIGITPATQCLHAFFHELPPFAVLFCSVDIEAGAALVRYRLRTNRPINANLLARATYHFEKLRLGDRFRRESLIEIGDRRSTFEEYVGPHNRFQNLRKYLRSEARGYRQQLGHNHWKTCLYTALARNHHFWAGGYRNLA